MYRSIFYKEWIKTGKLVILIAVVFAGGVIYSFISTGQLLRLNGAVNVWESIIMKDIQLLSSMKWLPILTAIALALAQFVPEMHNKRLKLTLHLPLPSTNILFTMFGFGIAVLLSTYLISFSVLLIGLRLWFAPELVLNSFYSGLPWFLSGFSAYALVTWICLEPVWRQRLINMVASIVWLWLFMIETNSGSYITFVPWLIGFTILNLYFPFFSVARFKDGAQ